MLENQSYIKCLALLLFGLLGVLGYGQITYFDEELRNGSLPSSWFETDIIFVTTAGGYARFDDLNSVLITPTFDASSSSSLDVSFEVAKFGSGTDGPITVDYSLDGGSTWVTQGNSSIPNDSSYQSNTITIPATSPTMEIRFTRINSFSDKRFRDLVIEGDGTSVPGYCPSSFPSNDADAITNVTLNTLDNSSGDAHSSNSNGYEDFTALIPTDLQQGQTYNLSVSIDSNGDFLYHIFAFFDWDGDLDFDSPIDESYDLGDNNSAISDLSTHDFDITVPNGAVLGNTRMRIVIMSADFGDPDPTACDPQFNIFGETEDYTVNVISSSTCNLNSVGLSNISCNDNGTDTNSADDIISFQLNPTGNNLGSTYSVDTGGIAFISDSPTGPFNSFVISGNNYGSPTTLYLEPGNAGDGDIDTIIYDDTDNNCLEIATVTDPGACSFGGGTTCGVEIDFETDGGYTTSEPEFTDGTADYFIRTDSSDIGGAVNFTNTDGSFFAAQDIDGEGASLPLSLNIQNINISNLVNLEFSIDLAEDDSSDSNEDWDVGDYVHITYSIDGGTFQNLLWIENDGTISNSAPFLDTDFDGTGDGNEITDTFQTFPQSIAGTGSFMNIRIEFNLDSGDEDIAIDNIRVCGVDNSIDSDSQVNEPTTQVPGGTIIADIATNTLDSVEVFKFVIEDLGTTDGLNTEVTQFRLVPGEFNTAPWSERIQGLRIVAETTGGVISQIDQIINTSNNDEIIIDIIDTPQDEMTILDGESREYTISVFLNETGIVDQEIIQFAIPSDTSDWEVVTESSQFVSSFTPFEGSQFVVNVVGNGLEFVSDASTTIVGETMDIVQVANTDSNRNIDLSLTAVELTSDGTLAGEPIEILPVNGIATFPGLTHTAIGNGLSLTATSLSALDGVSRLFNIIDIPELFITEIGDPQNPSSGDARYVEVYNGGLSPINFDNADYFIAREANGSVNVTNIKLTGIIEAKGYYTIGRAVNDGFLNSYGFLPNLLDPDVFFTISGDGNDTYFLSVDIEDTNGGRNSVIDIYGEIGVNGNGELWNYENSRTYRNNPTVKNANTTWTADEWTIQSNAEIADMTPGYGDNDYIFDGSWTNTGLGTNPDGVSTTSQNIFIRSGSVTLNGDVNGDIRVGDLVVRSGAILTLAPNVKLTVAGDILNEGTIIFDSDANSTAVLEALPSTTRVVGNGFEVRRYIPVVQNPNPIRAFRYLSSSVDTQNSAKPTINDNWQEGLFNPDINTNNSGTAGFGTHITGTDLGDNLGFDTTATGNPSMFEYDSNGQNWMSVPNTNSKTFGIGDAFAILVRGDRTTTLDSNSAVGPSTTLRTTGQIHVGDFTLNSSDLAAQDFFTLVGNPYQSQVDLIQLINSSTDIDDEVYIYDPTIGDLGATVTIDLSNPSNPVPSSSANQYLQPNQAFFVKAIGTGAEINFTEDIKDNSDTQTGVFEETSDDFTTLDISIKNANHELQDGIRIVYGDTYSNTVNYDDATKLFNSGETIAIESSSAYLSIEKRDWPNPMEVTNLNLYNLTLSDYVLSLDFQLNNTNMPEVFLVDHYTGQNTLVSTNALTNYSFSVDANIPESIASDRFQLTYSSSLSVDNFENESFLVYPNPLKALDLVSITSKDLDLEIIKSIEINTIQGKIIRSIPSSKLTKHGNSIQLKLNSTISKGTYLLKIITKENNYICKLIIN